MSTIEGTTDARLSKFWDRLVSGCGEVVDGYFFES